MTNNVSTIEDIVISLINQEAKDFLATARVENPTSSLSCKLSVLWIMEGIYYELLGECTEISHERDVFVYFSYASKPFYTPKMKIIYI